MSHNNSTSQLYPAQSRSPLSPIARLMALFTCSAYHTTYDPSSARPESRGSSYKIRVDYRRGRRKIDVATWQAHLDGRYPLTIPPNLPDGTVTWGAIDNDEYDRHLLELVQSIARLKISAICVRTKSNGLRILVFFDGRVPTSEAAAVLRAICRRLEISDNEIFPRGENVPRSNPIGINIPYCGYVSDVLHTQIALRPNGGQMSLNDFLRAAEGTKMGPDERAKLIAGAPSLASRLCWNSKPQPLALHPHPEITPELLTLMREDAAAGRGQPYREPDDTDPLLKMECALAAIPASEIPYTAGRDQVAWFKLVCALADNSEFEEGFAVLMTWSAKASQPHHRCIEENFKAWKRACERRKKAELRPNTIYHFANMYDPDRNWLAEYRRRLESGQ